jgi:cytochrome b561
VEAHPGSRSAAGLLLLTMAFTRATFLLVCLGVRAELEPGEATEELVAAAVLVVLYLLTAHLLVRGWELRYRRRLADRLEAQA